MEKEILDIVIEEVKKLKDVTIEDILTKNSVNIWFTDLYHKVYGVHVTCSTCNGEIFEAYNKLKNLVVKDLENIYSRKYSLKKTINTDGFESQARIHIIDSCFVEIDGENIQIAGMHTLDTKMNDKLARAIIKKFPSLKNRFDIKAEDDLYIPETPENKEIDNQGKETPEKSEEDLKAELTEKTAKALRELIPADRERETKYFTKTQLIDFIIENKLK